MEIVDESEGAERGGVDWKREWHALWEVLSCKWTFHIIRLLSTGSYGFNEMKREFDGITATMLSRRLKTLEAEGILCRCVVETSPPSTSYELTETGHELAVHLREIERLRPVESDGRE